VGEGEGDMGCSDKGKMYYFNWGQNLSPLKGRGLKPSGGIPYGCYLEMLTLCLILKTVQ